MPATNYAAPLKMSLLYFSRTCSVFKEEDSGFAPTPGQFTLAQHVAHVAQTIDWFISGGFAPEGFDMDFAVHHAAIAVFDDADRRSVVLADRGVGQRAQLHGERFVVLNVGVVVDRDIDGLLGLIGVKNHHAPRVAEKVL